MIIGSFNIRGGGGSAKRRRISNIISRGKADIFLLQETKLKSYSIGLANSFWSTESIGFLASDSEGLSGGLLILWKDSVCVVVHSFRGSGYLGVKVRWNNLFYYIVNIYSPCSVSLKCVLWSKLLSLKSVFSDGEWLIVGDFNNIKNKEERVGRNVGGMRSEWSDFEGFIKDIGLVDIPCKGKRFTWFSGDGRCKSRLDRFLVSNLILDRWGIVGQFVGKREISDHCPVWLMIDKGNWGPKPFKFNNEWFKHKDFFCFVEKEWLVLDVHGRGDYVLKEKLRLLKSRLSWWNYNVFGRIDLDIEEGAKDMNEIDDLGPDVGMKEEELKKASKKFWLNLKI
ncbi:uncharacterized protein LOC131640222 [Vicia villosa]|uniref:uncharacterized protein LOC131640222 n=1 Tax=Vicia villosa TaxID=3911 RepID=UPI00273ACD0D|nr:uncharacterized protein LOC131640222 [Vicia villosa]